MIDTLAARKRLLELAIHGELINSMSDCEDIENVVKDNLLLRAKLIKDGLTKKPKEKAMIEEYLFSLPKNWHWFALGDICTFISRGKSPKYSEVKKYPVFAQKCNQPNHLALEKALFLDETTLDKWADYFRLRDNDIVINSTGTGTVGRVGYYLTKSLAKEYPFMLPDSHVTVIRVGEKINSKYVYYVLRSPSIQSIMFKQFRGSTNQKEFYIDSVYATPIPLPCTEIQNMIAEKLDSAFKLLDIIDEAQKKYSADAEILKSKLITMGIQGKLTKPLDSDGTAEELFEQIQHEKQKLIKEGKIKKEKTLPPVADEEVPFEIPSNWRWCRLGNLSSLITKGSSPKWQGVNYIDEENGILFITSENVGKNKMLLEKRKYIEKHFNDSHQSSIIQKGDILTNIVGASIGRTAIFNENIENANINQAVCVVRLIENRMSNYVLRYMNGCDAISLMLGKTVDTARANLSLKSVSNLIIPLPPLAEQKRIADTLDGVLRVIG